MTELEKKESQAIRLIRLASLQHEYVVSYSGGKDSEVLLHLFKLARVPFTLVYRSTTIDPPGTISYVESKGAAILRPKHTFFELIRRKGLPSFARRFCCEALKEGYLSSHVALGIRAEESQKRKERYNAPEVCRVYTKKQHTSQLIPLVYWTQDDIRDYVNAENIKCHPLYYDCNKKFCVERRLGCLGCPLPWDRSVDDFYQYPLLVRQWCRNLAIFRKNHPNSRALKLFNNEFDQFAHNLFYHDYKKFANATYGLFPIDWKSKLEDEFHVHLL